MKTYKCMHIHIRRLVLNCLSDLGEALIPMESKVSSAFAGCSNLKSGFYEIHRNGVGYGVMGG